MDSVLDENKRWESLDRIFTRQGSIVGNNFIPNEETRILLSEVLRVLVVGAGGLGCELLKDLALTGFLNLDVIDMDTIDLSNLNRQFLFSQSDIGRPKAVVAAEKITSRIPGVKVTPHYAKIEDKSMEFYSEFHLIVLGLDSLEARRFMNSTICAFLEYDKNDELDPSSVKPIIDGGTEGFKGHARVILPGTTPCFECLLWLFPPQITYPMCTLAETPRTPVHCIEYVHQVLWERKHGQLVFDADNPEHMKWMYETALDRANFYGIEGVTYQLTQGVVKNIIPAIASSNAIISGMCALEVLKVVTGCSTILNNYIMYSASDGIYSHTVEYSRDPECPDCSPGISMTIDPQITLSEFIEELKKHPSLEGKLEAPSVSYDEKPLYMRGAFEASTKANLALKMIELIPSTPVTNNSFLLNINDKNLHSTLRLKLKYKDEN
eukprot:g343.t1